MPLNINSCKKLQWMALSSGILREDSAGRKWLGEKLSLPGGRCLKNQLPVETDTQNQG
jgi:hypothetical protein